MSWNIHLKLLTNIKRYAEIRNGTLSEAPCRNRAGCPWCQSQVLQADFKDLKQQEEMHFQQLHNLISQKVLPPKGSFQNPTNSCKSIPPGSASGKYWIQSTATGYASHEYCDMANTRCGTRGWMRVANLDMTDTSQHCPSGFRYVSGSGYRGCGILMVGAVYTPPSLCMEYGTAKYVEGWMPINISLLMHFTHTI